MPARTASISIADTHSMPKPSPAIAASAAGCAFAYIA